MHAYHSAGRPSLGCALSNLLTPVRHDADEVLRGQWLCDGQRERDRVLHTRPVLAQHPVLVMKQDLAVLVLHKDPEGLDKPVDLEHKG